MTDKGSAFYAGIYGVLVLLVALTLAWILMFKFDFFYGVWHDHGGIKEGIEEFGPENRYRQGFADTTRAQRLALFHAINIAVHSGGQGLEDIRYRTPTSSGEQTLLREPEIRHLQDVAELIDLLMILVSPLFVLWPLMAVYFYRTRACAPPVKWQLAGVGALLGGVAVVLIGFGPDTVFSTLHIWIFPKENPWFFYYQDSLMSTMMLAPVLFAWIAASLLIVALLIYAALTWTVATGVGKVKAV